MTTSATGTAKVTVKVNVNGGVATQKTRVLGAVPLPLLEGLMFILEVSTHVSRRYWIFECVRFGAFDHERDASVVLAVGVTFPVVATVAVTDAAWSGHSLEWSARRRDFNGRMLRGLCVARCWLGFSMDVVLVSVPVV